MFFVTTASGGGSLVFLLKQSFDFAKQNPFRACVLIEVQARALQTELLGGQFIMLEKPFMLFRKIIYPCLAHISWNTVILIGVDLQICCKT